MRPHRLAPVILAALFLSAAAPAPMRVHLPSPIQIVAAPDAAANNDAAAMDFLLRLGMLEGHLIVAHDLVAAHQASMALPHFGHPVRELYDDMADYLEAHKFPAFDTQLVRLESAAAAAPYAPETETRYQTVIKTLHDARDITPKALRASVPEMIQVCANTLDVASGEYSGALENGRIESIVEYHDSRGYVSWVTQYLDSLITSHQDTQSQTLLGRMKVVLAKAQWIVEPLLPSQTPRAPVSDYRAIAAEAASIAKQ